MSDQMGRGKPMQWYKFLQATEYTRNIIYVRVQNTFTTDAICL